MLELARALDAAVAEGRVAPLDAPTPGGLQPDEVALLRNRLFMLGYLDADNGRGGMDSPLEAALLAFEQDAGLSGADLRAAWIALNELVSFERDDGIALWRNDLNSGALRRAVHLRLFCLGLAPLGPRPRATGDDLERGLGAFVRLSGLLDPEDAPPAAISVPVLQRLFDHEGWVDRLARLGATVSIFQPAGAGRREQIENRELVTTFVLAVARIELWLHGYATLPRPRTASDAQGLAAAVSSAMLDFWADQPADVRPDKRERDRVDGRFFARLQAFAREAQRDVDAATFVRQLTADPQLQQRVHDEIRTLGARVWDGLKRAGHWIGALFNNLATNIRQLARNLARVLSAGAARVWGVVRNAVCAVLETGAFMSHGTMKGSDPLQLLVRHDGGFDLILVVNSNCDRALIHGISRLLLLRARLATIGMSISGYVNELLRDALKSVTAGWLALTIVLYRAAPTLLALVRDSDVAGELLGEIDTFSGQRPQAA